jgi:phosphoserine phosphatase
MTQLAETLFNRTPLAEWHSVIKQQRGQINQVTYSRGKFNISEQKLQVTAHYLALFGKNLSPHAVVSLLQALNQCSGEIILYPPNHCATALPTTGKEESNQAYTDILVLGFAALSPSQISKLTATLASWSHDYRIDYAFSNQLPQLAKPGVVLMDMDSTTIQIECIDEIAKLAGAEVGKQVAAVTARAMNGELDFAESLRSRVATLKGCPETVLKQVADTMPLMPGLELLIATLHQANWKVAIASGGFTYFAQRLQDDLGFDAVFANQLQITDGYLTGEVLGGIVDAQVKADTLQVLADRYQIAPDQTVAIGDGANDLLMLANAALGVAIHAKPVVQQQAQVSLNYHDLEGLVALLHCGACIHASWR